MLDVRVHEAYVDLLGHKPSRPDRGDDPVAGVEPVPCGVGALAPIWVVGEEAGIGIVGLGYLAIDERVAVEREDVGVLAAVERLVPHAARLHRPRRNDGRAVDSQRSPSRDLPARVDEVRWRTTRHFERGTLGFGRRAALALSAADER